MKIANKAYAKINLTLEVLNKRSDGYHNIRSIEQAVSIFDLIVINTTKSKDIKILCSERSVPDDENNLCYKAAQMFFNSVGITNPGIAITIIKKIPTQAGLGGASADAACTLHMLNKMFRANLSIKDLCFIGAKVGADVPFCLVGGTMLVQGIGEKLSVCEKLQDCYVVIVKPDVNICTRKAYDLIDSTYCKDKNLTDKALAALKSKNFDDICSCLYNRFETILNTNETKLIKRSFLEFGASGSLMTGSGSAVYGLFKDKDTALNCANTFLKSYKKVFICKTI